MFLINVKFGMGTDNSGHWFGVFLLIKVLQEKALLMPSKIINRSSCFKICFFESALDQCFQTHVIILQTGKLAFLPGSRGMEREREEQNYNHCLWRNKKVWLACLLLCGWEILFFTLRCPWYLGCARVDVTCFSITFKPFGPWRILFSGPLLYLPKVLFHDLVSCFLRGPLFPVAWVMAPKNISNQRNGKWDGYSHDDNLDNK